MLWGRSTGSFRRLLAAAAFLGGAAAALPSPAGGPAAIASKRPAAAPAPPKPPPPPPPAPGIGSLRGQVAEASAEEAAALDRLDGVASRRRTLDRELAALNQELARAQSEVDDAETRLAAVTVEMDRVAEQHGATARELDAARRDLTARAVSSYIHPPLAGAASALLEEASLRRVAATRGYVKVVVERRVRVLARYEELRDRIVAERRVLGAARDEVAAQHAVLAGHHAELQQRRDRQVALRSSASAEESRQAATLREVRARVRDFEAQLAAMTSESDAIGSMLRSRQSGQTVATSARGALATPVVGPIGSGFGPRVHPVFGNKRVHDGVDYEATAGMPIQAAADGVVVIAGRRNGYGNVVVIDHGNGLATLYAHQSRMAAQEGQAISRGVTLGYVGSTGYATGPHLHFEVRVFGHPVDPVRYL